MRIPAIAIISTLLSLNVSSVAAQSFEDRWSIIPKAHAEEPRGTEQGSAPAQPSTETPAAPQSDAAANSSAAARARSASDAPVKPTRDAHRHPAPTSRRTFFGKASFYAYQSGKTASGSAFNREARTAAHRHLPFGTKLRVTNVANHKSVVVIINDRGPHKPDRVLDLSLRAARILGITHRGVAEVRAEVL